MWAPTPQGMKWCGAKSSSATPFELSKACVASLLPAGLDKDLYCSRGGTCPHKLPVGYTRVAKDHKPPDSELVTKKKVEESSEDTSSKKKAKGRGSKGGRGGASKGRGAKK